MLFQPISCRVIRTNCDVFDVVQTGESLDENCGPLSVTI